MRIWCSLGFLCVLFLLLGGGLALTYTGHGDIGRWVSGVGLGLAVVWLLGMAVS